MSIAALDTRQLTMISLVPDGEPSVLDRLLRLPGLGAAEQIVVRGQTAAQRTALAARIDAAVHEADRAVMLVAQGAACAAAAWWARLSPRCYTAGVSGALMVAPAAQRSGSMCFASPNIALPFPSVTIGASDECQRLGSEWGSRMIDGPLAIDGFAPSNRLRALIARFTAAIVERDVSSAERLIRAIGDQ
ncbi:MAG TPA: alpha/beta hydrolase [Sphingomicrobium sp.]